LYADPYFSGKIQCKTNDKNIIVFNRLGNGFECFLFLSSIDYKNVWIVQIIKKKMCYIFKASIVKIVINFIYKRLDIDRVACNLKIYRNIIFIQKTASTEKDKNQS